MKSAAAEKRKTKAFFIFTTALTLKFSSSYRLEDSEYGAVSKSGSAKLERTSSKFLQKKKKEKYQQATTLFIYLRQNKKKQKKDNHHLVQSDLLKSSTHWKATMAPIR